MTSASAFAAAHDGPGGEDIAGAVARHMLDARAETLRAVEAFDDWQRAAPSLRHAHTVATFASDASKRVEAVAYVAGVNGMPSGEVTGYGHTTVEAIEDMARRGFARGVWR